MRARASVPAAAAVAAAAVGCGGAGGEQAVPLDESAPRIMTRVAPHTGGEPAAIVGGTLEVTPSRCVLLSGRPAVWPAGTEPVDGGVRLPGGVTVLVGDEVSGGGGFIPTGAREVLDRLVREDLAAFADCLRESSEVALFVAEPGDGDMSVSRG